MRVLARGIVSPAIQFLLFDPPYPPLVRRANRCRTWPTLECPLAPIEPARIRHFSCHRPLSELYVISAPNACFPWQRWLLASCSQPGPPAGAASTQAHRGAGRGSMLKQINPGACSPQTQPLARQESEMSHAQYLLPCTEPAYGAAGFRCTGAERRSSRRRYVNERGEAGLCGPVCVLQSTLRDRRVRGNCHDDDHDAAAAATATTASSRGLCGVPLAISAAEVAAVVTYDE